MRTTIPKQLLEKSALATYKGLLLQDRKDKLTSGGQSDGTATGFSQQELLALRLLYMMIDRHNDGHITAEELLQWAASDGRAVSREEADRCVAAVDADGDGAIGMHDFLLFAAQNKEEAKEES
jgi:Ca2+-binding EF-hand superfamily protein